jgi:hypothetical protein
LVVTRQFAQIEKAFGVTSPFSQLHVTLLRRYCAQGRLPAKKVNKGWAIRRWDVERFAGILAEVGGRQVFTRDQWANSILTMLLPAGGIPALKFVVTFRVFYHLTRCNSRKSPKVI